MTGLAPGQIRLPRKPQLRLRPPARWECCPEPDKPGGTPRTSSSHRHLSSATPAAFCRPDRPVCRASPGESFPQFTPSQNPFTTESQNHREILGQKHDVIPNCRRQRGTRFSLARSKSFTVDGGLPHLDFFFDSVVKSSIGFDSLAPSNYIHYAFEIGSRVLLA